MTVQLKDAALFYNYGRCELSKHKLIKGEMYGRKQMQKLRKDQSAREETLQGMQDQSIDVTSKEGGKAYDRIHSDNRQSTLHYIPAVSC